MKPIKILAISAFYPPYTYGGYENRVGDVLDELAKRGHQVTVLTTQPDQAMADNPIQISYPVIRRLHGTRQAGSWIDRLSTKRCTKRLGVALVFLRQIWRDIHDLHLVDKTIDEIQPDLIYLGNVLPIPRGLFPYLASVRIPLVLDDGGKTMESVCENHGLWFRFEEEFQPKFLFVRILKRVFISLVYAISSGLLHKNWNWPENINVIFNNQQGHQNLLVSKIPFRSSIVIHSGLDLQKFTFKLRSSSFEPLRIILPGRIEPRKGQLDAIRLSGLLHQAGINHSLTIVGDRWIYDYALLLEQEAKKLGLEETVNFLPMQNKEELLTLYHQADVCFFPSYQRTGFSRISLEAMACGCVLITYGNEGSDEITENGVNGFVIPPGDLDKVFETVQHLKNSPTLLSQITFNARQNMEEKYSMAVYVDKIESFVVEAMKVEFNS